MKKGSAKHKKENPVAKASCSSSSVGSSSATATGGGGRKRPLTAYKFFMKATIKQLKQKCPNRTIILPMVSRLCAQAWTNMDDDMKRVFQIEADHCEAERQQLGLDEYRIEIPKFEEDDDDDGDDEDDSESDHEPVAMHSKANAGATSGSGKNLMKSGGGRRTYTRKSKDKAVESLVTIKTELMDDADEDDNPGKGISIASATKTAAPVVGLVVRKGGRKSKTIPGGPRRPLSAFVWYCKDERRKVRQGNPGLSMGETSKILGKMWHALEPQDKERYQTISKNDRVRYSHELANFKKTPFDSGSASGSRSSTQANCDIDSADLIAAVNIKEELPDDFEQEWMPRATQAETLFNNTSQTTLRIKKEFDMSPPTSPGKMKQQKESLKLECDESLDDSFMDNEGGEGNEKC